jgi:hypothetical protein
MACKIWPTMISRWLKNSIPLLFLPQINIYFVTGLIIDYFFSDLFSVPKLIGGTMVFSGLVIDHLINNKKAKSVKQSDVIMDVKQTFL